MRNPRNAKLIAILTTLLATSIAAGCNGSEPSPSTTEVRAENRTEAPNTSATLATRRAPASCDVAEAALRWQPQLGQRTRTRLLWNDLPREAAALEIPFGVVAVRQDGVAVHLPQIPLREYYLGMWFASGHLRWVDQQLVLDACSAELVTS